MVRKYIALDHNQGDQIGEFLPILAVVFFGQVVENYKSLPNIWLLFSTVKDVYVFI
jgi:hypothetical protein